MKIGREISMKKKIEIELQDDVTVWGMGDVTHTPQIHAIQLDEHDGWYIGQKVTVTIEAEEMQCTRCKEGGAKVQRHSLYGLLWWYHEKCYDEFLATLTGDELDRIKSYQSSPGGAKNG